METTIMGLFEVCIGDIARLEKRMETTIMETTIMELYNRVLWGIYRENRKENGTYYNGVI